MNLFWALYLIPVVAGGLLGQWFLKKLGVPDHHQKILQTASYTIVTDGSRVIITLLVAYVISLTGIHDFPETLNVVALYFIAIIAISTIYLYRNKDNLKKSYFK